MRVTSATVNDPVLYPNPRKGSYELVNAPSPHNNDCAKALPQLPEDQVGKTMAVGSNTSYMVFRYSYYNAETDRESHDAQQAANEKVALEKGKPFVAKPFKDKGPSMGTWSYLYSEYNGKVVE